MQQRPDWSDLDAEFDRWASAGRSATLWWRDDDAARPTPALERLIGLARDNRAIVHLAVIPALLAPELAPLLGREPFVRVLQHGYAHIDHAPSGAGSWELGSHRPRDVILAELSEGRRILNEAAGKHFLPVLVPPWTRIDEDLVAHITEAGLTALSLEGARQRRFAAPDVQNLNAHCDPIKWKGGPRFTGTGKALDEIVKHLSARRTGTADACEPTGLCTHHLDHDAGTWAFVERLVATVAAHPAARWIDLAEAMEASA